MAQDESSAVDPQKATAARSAREGRWNLAVPVFLIGFMGAGKTSVAQQLAVTRGLMSVDADEYLELREDRVIADIFAEEGEEAFRRMETEVLRDLAGRVPRLIGCGGGAPLREENCRIMHDAGFVVYLEVTADEAAARIPNTVSRPLFKDLETARRTIVERMPKYEAVADAKVSTMGRTVPEIADEVADILERAGVLSRMATR